uniref:Uncharacterized protein n=1 Tax=Cacopsylla melanoneura TaxID=428564 RepID=A0A8D8V320_9HEMI
MNPRSLQLYLRGKQNLDIDFAGGRTTDSVVGGTLVYSRMMTIGLLNEQGGGLNGLLTRRQNVVHSGPGYFWHRISIGFAVQCCGGAFLYINLTQFFAVAHSGRHQDLNSVGNLPRFHGGNVAHIVASVLGLDVADFQVVPIDQANPLVWSDFGSSCSQDSDPFLPR